MLSKTEATVFAPGWFLAIAEPCERLTYQMEKAKGVTAEHGGKYIPMGTIYPANDGTAIGIVYEDVDVTSGDKAGSVVTKGTVYENRIEIAEAAKTALEALGFQFVAEPETTRPY